MDDVILVVNSGSSSIKFSIFMDKKKLNLIYHGEIENLYDSPRIIILNKNHKKIFNKNISSKGHEAGLRILFDWFLQLETPFNLKSVGHRVVHGGAFFSQPTLVNAKVIKQIKSLNTLAPLHQVHNLKAIQIINTLFPKLPQVVCFDTTFHLTQKRLAKMFAVPRPLTDEGIVRYGFHGLSYEYLASTINKHLGAVGMKRVIMAHLGNGASMCAMYQHKSVATTMGFTPLDGLMMGSRGGRIDPGVLLYLMQGKKYSVKQLEHLLYYESGLQGVSGISHDVRTLLKNPHANAKEAIALFCYRAALEFGMLSVALKGCDALVFTAGIGENSYLVRKKICDHLAFLGLKINNKANKKNSIIISDKDSKIIVSVIPTNEEFMVAKHTQKLLK